jgi:hypothetical protein
MFAFLYRGLASHVAAELEPLIADAIAAEVRRLDDRIQKRSERAAPHPLTNSVQPSEPYAGQPMGRSS